MAEADAVFWELSKGMGNTRNTCMFFVVSSPEVMAEADAVMENLLKVWGILASPERSRQFKI